jgi:gliding motility-associated-like protein
LYFTAISKRGIHIESTNGAPIAVYEHTYGRDAAGATLLFPTNTWGASYNVLTIGGTSNSGVSNSFFFVMAAEDNTLVDIIPTADIADSSRASIFRDNGNIIKYPRGVPFTIKLNKGEIFNAMSTVVSKVAGDLTGTLVKSQDCVNKKIMVMAGNGRTFVNSNGCSVSSGSDNLLQQMLPRVAWGTRYVTTPTKTMEYGVYRVCVQDPTTKVTVNGQPITGAPFNATLQNNFYYQVEGNAFLNVESDKPIMMVQYIITGGCKTSAVGNIGQGDPEMIILSPVQQAINNISVFSAIKQSISSGASYINVVIPKQGVASFKIDNRTTVDTGNSSYVGPRYGSSGAVPLASAFVTHPADPNYMFARFKVTSGVSHSLSSDSGFNAIAYGMAQGESYGYNAGTLIKDLTAVIYITNPHATIKGPTTCPQNAAKLEIALPYNRSDIVDFEWDPTLIAAGIVTPATKSSTTEAASWLRSYTEGPNTYNVYKAPSAHTFSKTGTYRLYVTVSGTFLSECGGKQVIPIDVNVVKDTVDFKITPDGCGSTSVSFKDTSRAHVGSTINSWTWDFGDGTSSNVQNPPKHNYTALGLYDVKLSTINSLGCLSDTVKKIDLSAGLVGAFTMSKDSICPSGQITFTSNAVSSGAAGSITDYNWTLKQLPSSPAAAKTGATFTQTFYNVGAYEIIHQVKTDAGCLSMPIKDTIYVMPVPAPDFDLPPGICVPGNVVFPNNTTIPDTSINSVTYEWYFGDGTPKTYTKDGLHRYTVAPPAVPGHFTVSLIATSYFGCASNAKLKQISEVYAPPLAKFTAPVGLCPASLGTFTDASTITGGQTIASAAWNFGDGLTATGTTATHAYTTPGTYPVTLTVTSNKGCKDDTTMNVVIDPAPVVDFSWSSNTCVRSQVSFTDKSSGTGNITKWTWKFGDGDSSLLQNPQHTYTSDGTKKVSLTVETASGCKNAPGSLDLIVHPSPVANFSLPVSALCLPATAQFTNTSSIKDGTLPQVTYLWNYDDNGTSSTGVNGSHLYTGTKLGGYNIRLTATSANGCIDDTVKNFKELYLPPTAGFSMAPSPVCENITVVFTDTSKVSADQKIVKWDWKFGDGKTALGYPMDHKYTAHGTYGATLTVTTDKGCASSVSPTQNILVNHLPVADFTALPGNICLGDSVLFSDHSTDLSTPIAQRIWEFGDGTMGSQANEWHQYTSAGNYSVKLTVINGVGCTSSKMGQVKVQPYPVLSLAEEVWVKPGSSVVLQPTVSNANASLLKYAWSPATYLNNATTKNPVSTPRSDIVYILTVTVDDACSAIDSIAVNLLKELKPPNAFSPNGDGINDVWNIPYLINYLGNKVEVFDRYGKIAWRSNGYNTPWDGTVNGIPLPVGVYYYVIDPKNGFEKITGSVTIIR